MAQGNCQAPIFELLDKAFEDLQLLPSATFIGFVGNGKVRPQTFQPQAFQRSDAQGLIPRPGVGFQSAGDMPALVRQTHKRSLQWQEKPPA